MIVLINPNSTEAMTQAMVETVSKAGIVLEGWTSVDGPAAIQGSEDGAACIPPLLALVRKASDAGAKTIIIGCFDDTGLEAAREIATCPVIGIGQAAYHMAVLAGGRFFSCDHFGRFCSHSGRQHPRLWLHIQTGPRPRLWCPCSRSGNRPCRNRSCRSGRNQTCCRGRQG